MKQNGRPPKAKRNAKIIAQVNGGRPCKEIAKELGLSVGYVQKIASEYALKQKREKTEVTAHTLSANFFNGLDLCLWHFVAGLKGVVRKHGEK